MADSIATPEKAESTQTDFPHSLQNVRNAPIAPKITLVCQMHVIFRRRSWKNEACQVAERCYCRVRDSFRGLEKTSAPVDSKRLTS
jgi:hypothetical protein